MALDIQMAMAMAPESEIYVFVSDTALGTLTGMANSTPLCNQLSSSWGIDATKEIQRVLLEFAAKGQSFFHASGDWGAEAWDTISEQPTVTVVGGTWLSMNPPGATYQSESAWPAGGGWIADGATPNTSTNLQPAVSIPYYQLGVTTGNGASSTYRNLPDVAMPSDYIAIDLHTTIFGTNGTSAASPLWAGYMALVNQQCTANGLGPVGFANPALYGIARTRGTKNDVYSSSFEDVTLGANHVYTCTKGGGCTDTGANAHSAGTGYDLATGLGSPKFELIGQLASSSPASNLGVAAGTSHACAIRSSGGVSCWGDNSDGQMGNGTAASPQLTPLPVKGLTGKKATMISAGGSHTCAVLSDKTVWCWGAGGNGQLGTGNTDASPGKAVQSKFSNAVAVAASTAHTCVLMADGKVQCAGINYAGQLGNNSTTSSSTPVTVSGITGVVSIATGQDFSCAVVGTDRHVECWGLKFGGGNVDPTFFQLVPAPVKDAAGNTLAGVASVAAGAEHVCALMQDTSLRCWGVNLNGQVGAGTGAGSLLYYPTTVVASCTSTAPLTGVIGLALMAEASCALMSDLTVRCWGDNVDAELGDTTSPSRPCPGATVGVSNVTAVSAFGDGSMTCSLGNYGISCWGAGYHGDGSEASISGPVTVHFF
jgi:alpha-tubulin suppressor-like RCC1 family protein